MPEEPSDSFSRRRDLDRLAGAGVDGTTPLKIHHDVLRKARSYRARNAIQASFSVSFAAFVRRGDNCRATTVVLASAISGS